MKRWIPWLAAALVVVLVGAGAWRAVTARQAQKAALAAQSGGSQVQAAMVLADDEVLPVRRRQLSLGVPVSGSLKAVNSAMVKARAGGELRGLTLREGDSVAAGQEVARIDATEAQARLQQARQQADAAGSQVEINQRQYDNNRALVDQGFISATALATSRASLEAARASHRAALAAADVARKGLDDTILRSPISGLVAQRLAQPGERVALDARILEVVDLSRLELEAQITPADSLAVRVGQRASLRVEGSATPLAATVVRISPSAAQGSRTVPVYLQVEQPGTGAGRGLRQGLFVQGTLQTGQADVLAVPLDAVRTDRPAPYLQTVKDGRVAYVPVTMGERSVVDGQAWVAVEGVSEGSLVIAGRIGQLREGTAVQLAAPGAQAPAASANSRSAD